MACDCMTTIDEKLSAEGANTKISRTYTLGAAVGMYPVIGSELVEKRRGAKPLALIPTYCPWCGMSYATGLPAAAKSEVSA